MKSFSLFAILAIAVFFVPRVVFADNASTSCAPNSSWNGTRCVCDDGYGWNYAQTVCEVKAIPPLIPSEQNAPPVKKNSTKDSVSVDTTTQADSTSTADAATKKPAATPQSIFNQQAQNELSGFVDAFANFFHWFGNGINSLKNYFVSMNAMLSK